MSTERSDRQGRGRTGQRIEQPIEERSPNNQSSGGKDFEDYPGGGPVPVGEAPVHQMQNPGGGMPMGVDVAQDMTGNPGVVPNANTGGPSSTKNIGEQVAEETEGVLRRFLADHNRELIGASL